MKRKLLFFGLIATFPFLFAGVLDQQYVILGWNDLGMHCANKNFSKMAILPPYNNLKVQIIQKGDASTMPMVLTTGYSVTYEVPGNTYSDGKTNFWTYVNQLFGVSPAPNIGLTGVGLTGNMDMLNNHFHVEGIPLTPYPDSDLVNEHPYQLALMKAFDAANNLIGQTRNVIPVSAEISCVSSGCHGSEQGILNAHESVTGFNANGPNLCASCHADNALGTTGTPGTPIFSKAIHGKHGGYTNNCYKCHPGPNTQCYRDAMKTAGFTCQDCHGSVAQVASSITAGRQPWLQEPSCSSATCHGSAYAPEPNLLFRQSKGHGGLFCSACHGSPHAIVPTTQPNDNLQNITYQGWAGKLALCSVCHGVTPNMPGPHGAMPTAVNEIEGSIATDNSFVSVYPNPANDGQVNLQFQLKDPGNYKVLVFDINGRQKAILAHQDFSAGQYSMKLNTLAFAKGTYIARLSGKAGTFTRKFLIE
ncbi:MAG: T9SS type A sorting domain-containing protein [Bacteroidetes bacterium]|nr:T9SS type A sorting domain-containing protein [Bacteroidota bacterium]